MVSATVYRPVHDIVVRKVGDESVIVPLRTNVADLDSVIALNPVASRIWELIDGHRTLDAIVETICDEYEVSVETARTDVDELIRSLGEAQLIEEVR